MTRVNENQEKARMEQARMEKQAQKDARAKSDDFSRLVGQRQENTSKANASKQRQEGAMVKNQTAQTRAKASNALLARQGIQANKFQQALVQQGDQNIQQTKGETLTRTTEQHEVREFNTQQEQVREKKEMDKNERVQAVRDEDGEAGSGEGGMGGGGGGMGQSHDGSPGGQLEGVAGVGEAGSSQGAAEAQGALAQPRIAPEIIQKIVRQVLVGIDEKGLGTVHVDFKGSELEGTSMTITADGNKIHAKVFTDNKNLGRMFKASHTDLARALKSANLSLESLEVTGAV
ncbi:MAG: hypothetical protein AAFU77_13695 [Myxococcota bacterium]